MRGKRSNSNLADVLDSDAEETESFEGFDFTKDKDSLLDPPLPEKCSIKKEMEGKRQQEALKRVMIREKTNIWENACNEVQDEHNELNAILMLLGLPPSNYSKLKSFPFTLYDSAPSLKCLTKDYLDYYVFPHLMSAIQALINFTRSKRILQCRRSTFSPLDFLSEYLYNNNPLHPYRQAQPTPLYETNFAENGLKKYPRPPLPKWLSLPADRAALIIQRAYRGYLVRKREDVQEVRKFWKEYKQDLIGEEAKRGKKDILMTEEDASRIIQKAYRGYKARQRNEEGQNKDDKSYDIFHDPEDPTEETCADSDSDTSSTSAIHKSHSQECEICARFKEFISKTNDTLPEKSTSTETEEKPEEQLSPSTAPPFISRYDHCCFHPEGHLNFTTHPSNPDLPASRRPPVTPVFLCISKANTTNLELPRKQSSNNQFPLKPPSNQRNCHIGSQTGASLPNLQSPSDFVEVQKSRIPCELKQGAVAELAEGANTPLQTQIDI